MTFLYIDIETIPSQKPDAKDGIIVAPPGNFKKPESIQKWIDENKEIETEKQYQKFSLDGALGEILCIGYAFNDGPVKCIGRDLDTPESEVLSAFMAVLSEKTVSPTWVGHYITGFDLRFLWQRYVVNSIKPSVEIPINAKPWESDKAFDTMFQWTGAKKAGVGSLDAICKAFDDKGKGDMDGSMIWDYAKDGRFEEIFEYCKDDVEKTRFLHKKLTFSI